METKHVELKVYVPRGITGFFPRRYLAKHGFEKKEGARSDTYRRKLETGRDYKRIRRYCRRKGLAAVETDSRLARSSHYRRTFFRENKGPYRCAYCGKKLAASDLTVDHILPVHKFSGNRARWQLRLIGAESVNDYVNLAPSCSRCNGRKGAKSGIWSIRGFIGKSYARRTALNWIRRFFLLVFIAILVYTLLHLYTVLSQYISFSA